MLCQSALAANKLFGLNLSLPDMQKVSLVIPAYNEERRLPPSLVKMVQYFKQTPYELEVLAIIEKSKDKTVEASRAVVAGDSRFQVIDNQVKRGKGYAVRSGMLRATGDVVFFMDADLSTPLDEVDAFLSHFVAHPEADVVIGSREHARSNVMKAQHPLRRNMGRIFNLFVQLLAGEGITDTQCGFKAFRREACEEVFSRQKLNGFAFDVEVLMLARLLGYKVEVLGVKWVNDEDSKVNIVRDSLKMLRDLIKTRWLVSKSLREKPPTKRLR